jgi:hypothetical protein
MDWFGNDNEEKHSEHAGEAAQDEGFEVGALLQNVVGERKGEHKDNVPQDPRLLGHVLHAVKEHVQGPEEGAVRKEGEIYPPPRPVETWIGTQGLTEDSERFAVLPLLQRHEAPAG